MTAPQLVVEAIELYERDVALRMPFRFGVVTLTHAPQAFVRVRVRLADGTVGEGAAAELLAPKWFDKNPKLSNEDNFDQLRAALHIARVLYLDGASDTAFGHFARHYRTQLERGAQRELIPLVANYGPALIDRAVLDALCRALNLPFHAVMQANLAGIGPSNLCPDMAGTRSGWSIRSRAPTRPNASATACPKRCRRWSPPTAIVGSSSRWRAT
jgi:hypothetical protein